MTRRLGCAWVLAFPLAAMGAPVTSDFAWRAPLDVPAGASLVRVAVPASALARVQHADARDVRVFNAAGETVPFAWVAPPDDAAKPAEERTRTFTALPLYASTVPRAAPPRGAVQVRIEGDDRSMWVRLDGTAAAGSERLDSVVFATRAESRPIEAVDVQATLPANTPVRIAAATSADLASWTPVGVRGRIYRFEGRDAPSNMRIEFDAPVALKDRYLRLDWDGQPGVTIAAATGIVARPAPAARRLRAELPAATQAAADTLEIATGFATPIAAIRIEATQANTVVPVRVLGRRDVSQPWRVLGQTVAYRIGQGTEQVSNPPLEVDGASVRWLRVVTTDQAPLAPAQLRIGAEFRPAELVLVASGAGPFTLAAGKEEAGASALPAASLTDMLGSRKVQDLPLARVGDATQAAPVTIGPFAGVRRNDAALWAVLALGVLVLGAVARSLLRQMKVSAG